MPRDKDCKVTVYARIYLALYVCIMNSWTLCRLNLKTIVSLDELYGNFPTFYMQIYLGSSRGMQMNLFVQNYGMIYGRYCCSMANFGPNVAADTYRGQQHEHALIIGMTALLLLK